MSRRKLFEIDLPPDPEVDETATDETAAEAGGRPAPGLETKSAGFGDGRDASTPGRGASPSNPGRGPSISGPGRGPSISGPGRGPMASAVRETLRARLTRAEDEAAVAAENHALAEELLRLKAEGLFAERVPLDLIDETRLTRDRRAQAAPDVEDLKTSIRETGLSNPIRVERAGARYELIQGWRRLRAFRALLADTGAAQWATIPAAVEPEGGDLELAYRRMVDENLVREDISFAEMAELARAYAEDPRTGADTAAEATGALYRSAGAQKRSYIRAFAELLEMLDGALAHPQALPRSLGLDLRRVLAATGPQGAATLRRGLEKRPERDAAEETAFLRRFVTTALETVADIARRGGAEDPSRIEPPAVPRLGRPPAPALEVRLEGSGLRAVLKAGRLEMSGLGAAAEDLDEARLRAALEAFERALRG